MLNLMNSSHDDMSIAIIGASRDPAKWGHRVIRYTRNAGFTGAIFAVNPSAAPHEIPGATVVATVGDITTPPDLALIALPSDRSVPEVSNCAKIGARSIIVAASGFGEHSAEGAAAEETMLATARESTSRIIGPNCFGVYLGSRGVNLTPFGYFQPGDVALASQSGNIAGEIGLEMRRYGLGFSHCVGVGNQLDVGFPDLLHLFANDPSTKSVALYLEGLQVGAGAAFQSGVAACRDAGKPVFVIKGGASSLGAAATMTHTRSLAADDRVWGTVLATSGAVRISSATELVDAVRCTVRRTPHGRNLAIVTDGGGDSALALDALSESDLELAPYSPHTVKALEALLPPDAPRAPGNNPITLDTAGGVEDDPLIVSRTAAVITADPAVDIVVLSGLFGSYVESRAKEIQAAQELIALAAESGVTVVAHSPLLPSESEPLALLESGGIPVFDSVDRALRAISRVVAAPCDGGQGPRRPAPSPLDSGSEVSQQWPIGEAAQWLRDHGVHMPTVAVTTSVEDLVAAAETMGYPVCLKTADPSIVHKSDVGGVQLNLTDGEAVRKAEATLRAGSQESPMLVMPHLPAGFELLIGAFHDDWFGPVIVIGRGGVLTELESDSVLVVNDFSRESVRRALSALRCYPVLTGYRGGPPLAIDAVCDLAASLGNAIASNAGISIDLNPAFVYEDRCAVADWRIMA